MQRPGDSPPGGGVGLPPLPRSYRGFSKKT